MMCLSQNAAVPYCELVFRQCVRVCACACVGVHYIESHILFNILAGSHRMIFLCVLAFYSSF